MGFRQGQQAMQGLVLRLHLRTASIGEGALRLVRHLLERVQDATPAEVGVGESCEVSRPAELCTQ